MAFQVSYARTDVYKSHVCIYSLTYNIIYVVFDYDMFVCFALYDNTDVVFSFHK